MKAFGMWRAGRLLGVLVAVVMGSSVSSAKGDSGVTLRVACAVAATVDPARGAAVCDEILATLDAQPDLVLLTDQPAPLTTGPGLEVLVDRVGDTALEITPTWIDAEGQRTTQPALGIRSMDRTLTESRRRDFYLRLIADFPR
jgi:hypothetical protein